MVMDTVERRNASRHSRRRERGTRAAGSRWRAGRRAARFAGGGATC